jgi:plastocyanin
MCCTAVMLVGIAVTACGSTTASSSAEPARTSADATTSAPAATAFGVGGKALGAPKVIVQMQYDGAQEYGLYVPATVSIAVGAIVEWDQVTLNDQELHNVTFDADPSSVASSPATMRYGSVWQVRFTRPGTFPYICTYHKLRMKGSVTVVG